MQIEILALRHQLGVLQLQKKRVEPRSSRPFALGTAFKYLESMALSVGNRQTGNSTRLVYSSLKQWYAPVITLQVRTKNNPKLLTETIRRELTATNGQLPFLDPRTMSEHISASTFVQVVGASMLSGFGILALLLAAVGLYGVLSYVVSLRRRELAVRAALGAAPKDVMNLVIKQGMTLVVIGLGIGAAISFVVARLLQSQLLGVEPTVVS